MASCLLSVLAHSQGNPCCRVGPWLLACSDLLLLCTACVVCTRVGPALWSPALWALLKFQMEN